MLLVPIFFILVMSTFSLQGAAAVPVKCNDPNIHVLSMPIFADRSNSQVFDYRFQWINKSIDKSMPTIIFLPGGPGGTSMDFYPALPGTEVTISELILGLPKNYSVIFTDPRGSGCNRDVDAELPEKAFTTQYLANDILAMIRALGLSNYILMGHSYGSLLATVVAARAADGEAIPPRAVVLSGVLGKVFVENEQRNAFEHEWMLIRSSLPKQISNQFPANPKDFENAKNLPFGLSAMHWGSFIVEGIIQGSMYSAGGALVDLRSKLLFLLDPGSPDSMALRKEVMNSGAGNGDLESRPVFYHIACSEFSKYLDICKTKNVELSAPYDSAEWQIRTPIFYVQGLNDPSTPPAQAVYHFSKQKGADKYLVMVPGAGHPALGAINECKDKLWQAILNSGAGIEESLTGCTANPLLFKEN